MVCTGIVVALIKGWLLTLILLPLFVAAMIFVISFSKNSRAKSEREDKNYSKAGGMAEQAIMSIKTVKALNG